MRRAWVVLAVVGLLLLSVTNVTVVAAASVGSPENPVAQGDPPAPATFRNPVTGGTVDTFPDPVTIRGKDGWWYAYGTTNPIFNSKGETGEHILPILKSADLVSWQYVGDVYAPGRQPSFWPARARAWAPDIRYVDGRYHLTYGLSSGGIALVTSESPTGPWTDHGLIVAATGGGCPTGAIDQSMFTDSDGTHYLYWGSYDTICVSAMNADATALTGEVTQVAQGRRAEGAYVVKRGAYYYLMMSDAGCCDGEFSGYAVKVGRSTSPRGPFVTQDGQPMMDRRSKGGIVIAANGNSWAGPGHNSIQTDLAGQDWLVYHAIPTADPNFPPVDGATGGTLPSLSKRPMLIDRLDWIDGWPVVRGGAGPSDEPQPVPVTRPLTGGSFDDRDGGALTLGAGQPSYQLIGRPVTGNLRVEADLRLTGAGQAGAVGLVVSDRGPGDRVVAWLDRSRNSLVVRSTAAGRTTETAAALPATFDHGSWHTVAAELRGTALTVDVSADRLRDAVATVTTQVAAAIPAVRIGVAASGVQAQADNLSAAKLHEPATATATVPQPGAMLPAYSDEFDGTGRPEQNDPAWSWVRGETATATEGGGTLTWPTQAVELAGRTNNAPVLLRDAPDGDFVVETKLRFDGTRGNQQAGIVLYENDDRYLKLVHSVLPIARVPGAFTHQLEFTKEAERPTTVPPTAVFSGPMFGGPPSETTWMRLAYHRDHANNEHDVRMGWSPDGVHWTWGGSWTLPVKGSLRLGLISLNASGAVGTFDYLRTYRLQP